MSHTTSLLLFRIARISILFFTFLVIGCSEKVVLSTNETSIKIPKIIKKDKGKANSPDYDSTLVSQYIRSIFQDSKGNLWFGTLGEGVVRYDTSTLRYFDSSDGFHCNSVFAINEDRLGNLWFGTDQGVYKFDGSTFKNYSQKEGLGQSEISRRGILIDKSGRMWVGSHHGLYLYDPKADAKGESCFFILTLLPPVNIADIVEDLNGNIWIATFDNGIYKYDGVTFTNYTSLPGLSGNYAGGVAQDKSGNMWFIFQDGICKFDGNTFTSITAKDGLGGTEFWGIYIDHLDRIWVTARGSTSLVVFDSSNKFVVSVFTPSDGLNCCVQSMYEDKSGNMWWGAGSGLFRYDGKQFYKVKRQGPW